MAVTDPGELGAVLGVWAHPDDEAYLSAGIMAAAVRAGHRVTCVTATRGEAGTDDPVAWPPERLGALRERELAACLAVLDVTEHHWLDCPDGGCAAVDPEPCIARITRLVEQMRPDTVLTFGPDGMTGHPDHVAVGAWTTEAVRRAGTGARLYYATKTPAWNDFFFRHVDPAVVMMVEGMAPPATAPEDLAIDVALDGADLELKMKALAQQASQVQPLVDAFGDDVVRATVRDEFFRSP